MRKRSLGVCLLLTIVTLYLPASINAAEVGWWWPCPSNLSISSYYGMRTYNGVTRLHRGVDIPGARGAEVIASKSGIARIAHPNNPFYDDRGRCIVIDHEDGYYSVYQHLSGYAIGDNVRVAQGQVIGYVGGSGSSGEYAYGAHLHFEIHKYYTNNALTILNLDWSKGQNTAVTSINPYPTYITPDNPRPSDSTPAVITNFSVSNISSSSFTINCTANEKLSSAYIILYCPAGEKNISVNDINSSSLIKTVSTGDYGGAGTYNLHIYVYDIAGNVTSAISEDFVVPKLVITNVTISNKDSTSFTVNCSVNNTVASAYFIIYGPEKEYHCSITDINSRSFSKKLYLSDYGGVGSYTLHVYVTDYAGNTVVYVTDTFAAPGEFPTTPTISIQLGNENEPTIISWYSQYAKDYWICIRNEDDTWYTSAMNTTHTSWTNQFKPGTYKVHVEAVNDYGRTSYGYISFTVPQVGICTFTTVTRSSDCISVQTRISNLTQDALCVIALYDSNDILIGQTIKNINNSTNSIVTVFNDNNNASYVKVFLWNSLESMKSLTDSEKVNV